MANIRDEAIAQYLHQKTTLDNLIKSRGFEDLYIFNKYVLGVEQGKQKLAPFHRELCNFVTDAKDKKKLMLLPRGHLKSTLVTIGYATQQITKNPNTRVLILSATWQVAVDFLTEIKRHLTTNERLIELYGDIASNPDEWSQDRITLRRTDTNIKGPTAWAAGIESNLVGSHPDIIILDDVVSRENTGTREQIEKIKLRYRDLLDLLEPGGQFLVIGTRWVVEDLYGWLMDREANISSSYKVLKKEAYIGNLQTDEIESYLWPEKFNAKILKDLLREKGMYEFSAQYLNNPVPAEDATFRKENFRYYNREDNRGKQMKKVLTIDPAISVSKDADMTAMVGSGIDTFSNIFIMDIIRAHLTPQQIIDKIFDLQEMYHFDTIGIETIAFQKALAYSINEQMRTRRRFLPIVEIKSHDKTKDQRIKGLQPLYENNQVYHDKQLENNIYLEDELLTFPRGRRDDVIDALSMQLDFWNPPRQKRNRYQNSYLY